MPTARKVNRPTTAHAPRLAMILAAGLGVRMRPITNSVPKPLVTVGGRTLLDRAIDRLEDANVEQVVVNTHYLAEKIEHHIKDRRLPQILLSHEDQRLETGGGVANALPLLGKAPFFVINGDILWIDGVRPTLEQLSAAWDDELMDGLLLLHPTVSAYGYHGMGDFLLRPDGELVRRPERTVAPYMFAGIQILHPRIFNDAPNGAFSLNLLYDNAIGRQRLFGLAHDGRWFHVGMPEDLALAEAEVPQPSS
jgi:MurNAc alpha-1-phosphate uridylyltransferase